eukprot:5138997-Alexandrium_andersonii.AAC.1
MAGKGREVASLQLARWRPVTLRLIPLRSFVAFHSRNNCASAPLRHHGLRAHSVRAWAQGRQE